MTGNIVYEGGNRMRKMPIIRIRPIRGIFDSDWDGVPNDRDCVWWNPNRQEDIFTMKEFDTLAKAQKQTKNIEYFRTLARIYGISNDKIDAYIKKFRRDFR